MAISGPAPTLQELEQRRLALLAKVGIAVALLVFALLAALAREVSWVVALIGLCIGALLIWIAAVSFFSSIAGLYKKLVLPEMVAKIAPGLRYQADGIIDKSEFKNSGLFRVPDRYASSDLFEGLHGQTTLRFGMVQAEEEYTDTTTDSSGDRREETKHRPIFSGLLLVAEFDQRYSGRTLVYPGGPGFWTSLFGTSFDMLDPDFNKLFTVKGGDEREAQSVLTPSLMARFMALRTTFGNFHASFYQRWVFIAVPMSMPFRPGMFTPMTDPVQLQQVQAMLTAIIGIVDDLGLNEQPVFSPPDAHFAPQ